MAEGATLATSSSTTKEVESNVVPVFDKEAYDRKLLLLANNGTTTASSSPSLWPVKATYPNSGAILPDKRIIAYYGNFYSKGWVFLVSILRM